jgi:hypothetical protein
MNETLTIPKYSYSQLMTWDRCHFSWFLNYHEGWSPLETKVYFQEGNMGHDLLMVYYKNIPIIEHKEAVRLVKTRVGQYLQEAGQESEKLEIVSTISRVVKGYLEDFARIEDRKWQFLDAEKNFEIPLVTPKGRKYYLEGRIDILARELSTGKIWIWDHKFIGRGKWYTPGMLLMDSQMPTYVAALQSMGIPIFGVYMNQLNKHEYAKAVDNVPEKLYKREPIFHTNAELISRLQETGNIVDEIEAAKETEMYRRSINKDCDSCFWKDPCLMSLKVPEAPVGDFMVEGFRKKSEKKALI